VALVDYVLVISAAVITAAIVILAGLLSRYDRLVKEADKSTRLAKDVWDSVNSRFAVIDGRIIDLMVKTDVLSSRLGVVQFVPDSRSIPGPTQNIQMKSDGQFDIVKGERTRTLVGEGTETEARVLRFLVGGAKSSAEIKDQIGRSREHTARLMKALFERGLVVRNDRNKPYVYEITESGRSYVAS
jgi:Winged helix DNA-binding domain